jgi:rhomboid-like protein
MIQHRVFGLEKKPLEEYLPRVYRGYHEHGIVRDVLAPILFALLVGGGAILIANTDQAKEWHRKRLQQARRLRSAHRRDDSALATWWRNLGDSGKTIGAIITVNAAVYGIWQLPQAEVIMNNFFVHSAASGRVTPMLFSCFSHKSALHLLFNMYGLYLFGTQVHEVIGREQFLALYIAGGMSASLFSHLFKHVIRDPVPSLGASGAIFAVVAASAYFDPYTRMQFIFFPFMNFSKEQLVLGMALFDTFGLVSMALKKHFFSLDHAAHLGGVAFGWAYSNWLYPKRRSSQRRH